MKYIMVEYIFYTGVGSNKNGKHSVEEFMKIMNEHFLLRSQCSKFIENLECKSCKEYKKMDHDLIMKNLKQNKSLADKNGNLIKNKSKKYKKLVNECKKYRKTAKKRKCTLEEYIEFIGAEKK